MSNGSKEERVRVTFNLPLNDESEESAVLDIIKYLQTLRIRNIGVTGFTHSDAYPPVVYGYWWGRPRG